MSKSTFRNGVSRIKSSLRSRIKNGAVFLSALDVTGVQRGSFSGSSRGAVVRRAFTDLVDEGLLVPTSETVYNPDTHHSVTVYAVTNG